MGCNPNQAYFNPRTHEECDKDNLTGEQIEYTTYKDWYASKKTQQTMGKKKYADYVDGLSKKYKTKDFSELLDRMTEKEYEKLSIIDVTGTAEEIIKR